MTHLHDNVRMTFPQSQRQQIEVDGHPIHLTAFEHRIAVILVMRPGIVTATDLLEALYPNPDDEPDTGPHLVKRHVWAIRNKGVPIVTVHGRGYEL